MINAFLDVTSVSEIIESILKIFFQIGHRNKFLSIGGN